MAAKAKGAYGDLGAEAVALREELDRLTAAIDEAAKAEGADAMKAVSQAAREIFDRASTLMERLPDKAADARAAMSEHRAELEDVIREKPLLAVGLAALAGFVLAALVRR